MAPAPTRVAAAGPRRSRAVRPHPARVVVVLLVVGLTAWHAREASQHLLTDRDPGVHVTTARWLAREGTLLVDPAQGPFAGRDDLVFEEQGWNLDDEGRLEPQFLHLLPVVLAVAQLVGGDRLLLVAPTAIAGFALLAVFAFARRVVRPWWALTATAALALSLPWVHLSRDAFSEPLAVLLLFSALSVLWDGTTAASWRRTGVAGLLFGAVAMTRVEGFVALLPLAACCAVALARAAGSPAPIARRTRRAVAALVGGVVVTSSVAAADLVLFGTWYLGDLGGLLTSVATGLLAVVVGGGALVLHASSRSRRRAATGGPGPAPAGGGSGDGPEIVGGTAPGPDAGPSSRRRAAGRVASASVVALAAAAWVVRPLVSTVTGAPSVAIAAIEQRDGLVAEGLVAEGVRRYSEHSVQWLGWYLGPVALALGIAGAALAAGRLVGGDRGQARLLPFFAVFATISALYLWRPSIVPDHIWAMRRYTIVTLPGLVVLAGWAGQCVVDRLAVARRRASAGAAGAAAAAAMIAFPVTTILPVAGATTQEGLLGKVGEVCEAVGGDGVVVVLPGAAAELVLAQSLRSFCGVPVAIATPELGDTAVGELAASWAVAGRSLHLVGADEAVVSSLAGRPAELVVVVPNDEQLEATLTRRPDELVAVPFTFVVADAAPPAG